MNHLCKIANTWCFWQTSLNERQDLGLEKKNVLQIFLVFSDKLLYRNNHLPIDNSKQIIPQDIQVNFFGLNPT